MHVRARVCACVCVPQDKIYGRIPLPTGVLQALADKPEFSTIPIEGKHAEIGVLDDVVRLVCLKQRWSILCDQLQHQKPEVPAKRIPMISGYMHFDTCLGRTTFQTARWR